MSYSPKTKGLWADEEVNNASDKELNESKEYEWKSPPDNMVKFNSDGIRKDNNIVGVVELFEM